MFRGTPWELPGTFGPTGVISPALCNNPELRALPAGLARLEHLTELRIDGRPGLTTLQALNENGGVTAVHGYLWDRCERFVRVVAAGHLSQI